MRLPSIRPLALAIVALLAVALAACGGPSADESDRNAQADSVSAAPATTLEDSSGGDHSSGVGASAGAGAADASGNASPRIAQLAMSRLQEADSIRFAMEFVMRGLPDAAGDVAFSAEGAVDQSSGDMVMAIDFGDFMRALSTTDAPTLEEQALLDALFGDGVIEMRQVDGTAYMRWPALSALFGANTSWVSFPADDAAASTFDASGFVASDEMIEAFETIGSITEVGRETLHGVATSRYEAVIDYSLALDVLSEGAPLPLDAETVAVLEEWVVPFGLWIDDDGLIRRLTMDINFADLGIPEADLADGPMSISMVFDVLEVGTDVVITAPPTGDVTDMSGIGGGSLFGDLTY